MARKRQLERWLPAISFPAISLAAAQYVRIRRSSNEDGGPRVEYHHYHDNPKFRCSEPFLLTNRFLPEDVLSEATDDSRPWVKQAVRCRRCAGCLRQKRAMWVCRAVAEAEYAAESGRRTWVLTSTHRIRPDMGGDAMFERAINLALKRLRKLGRFRYLLVFERHKSGSVGRSGYPHCHALVHEVDRLMYDDFEAVFRPIGFFRAKLLSGDPARSAAYVAKYMSKGGEPTVCRVRASIGYGEPRRDANCDNSNCGEFTTNQAEGQEPIVTNNPVEPGPSSARQRAGLVHAS